MPDLIDQQPDSPYHSPDWRWKLALAHVANPRSKIKPADEHVRLAMNFLRSNTNSSAPADTGASLRWQCLARALRLHSTASAQRDEVEARLITGQDFEEISRLSGVLVDVVVNYERFFFNVVGASQTWLIFEAVRFGPCRPKPNITEGDCWRYIALAAGPHALDVLIADTLQRKDPETADRHRIADNLRFLVSEYAVDWSDRKQARAHIGLWCTFHREYLRRNNINPKLDLATAQLRTLRLTYGMKPLGARYFKIPKPGRQKPVEDENSTIKPMEHTYA